MSKHLRSITYYVITPRYTLPSLPGRPFPKSLSLDQYYRYNYKDSLNIEYDVHEYTSDTLINKVFSPK